MRVLLLMRGAAGVGKSTWIKEHGLKEYALAADDIRMMYQSPLLMPNGKKCVAPTNEKAVWNTLFQVLEARMDRGEFVVIDATNSKTVEMNRYKNLAETYRYRIYCVDFTDVPIEVCKQRNKMRPEYKQVPEEAIDNMYSRFATQKIPSGIKVLKPNELDSVWFSSIDFSEYKKIHHIGDIHGCFTVLKEYLRDGLKDDELYIFCGDYIDRGIENVEVIKFLLEIYQKKNVLLLEGNHERWLWYWANGRTGQSKEFEMVTRKKLDNSDIDPKLVRMLYRKFIQCAYYTYRGKTVLVTHAGISCIPDNLTLIATSQMIRGVGQYQDYIQTAESFENSTDKNVFQIFGHRNTERLPIQMSERTFNLEGRVEFGEALRVVTLSENGFKTIAIKNDVFREIKHQEEYSAEEKDVMKVVDDMRRNKSINEKRYGNISSFNFARSVFYDRKWNDQTIKARGLFINTSLGKVVARSYEKFFNIDERDETKFSNLRNRFSFPVTAYVKENGFLGLVSYNEETDDLIVCSKSTPEGPFAELMKEKLVSKISDKYDLLKDYLKTSNVTLVFECVDPDKDPHIIEYDHDDIYLLDIINNQLKFEHASYERIKEVAGQFGFTVKTRAAVLNDWDEFKEWYESVNQEDYKFEGRRIEGFVLEDAKNFMVKVKLPYYTFWKHMRSVAEEVFKSGNYRKTGSLLTPEANLFYGFCRNLYNSGEEHPDKIIELRKMFLEQT